MFLVCTLLHQGWDDVPNWPTDFVMAYLEDATGERSWCANAETKQFVANILTAFRTDVRLGVFIVFTPSLYSSFKKMLLTSMYVFITII